MRRSCGCGCALVWPAQADARPPAADARPPAADAVPPAADARPPAADARPPAADARPPTADARPPTADARPPTADARPPTADARPPTAATFVGAGRRPHTPRRGMASPRPLKRRGVRSQPPDDPQASGRRCAPRGGQRRGGAAPGRPTCCDVCCPAPSVVCRWAVIRRPLSTPVAPLCALWCIRPGGCGARRRYRWAVLMSVCCPPTIPVAVCCRVCVNCWRAVRRAGACFRQCQGTPVGQRRGQSPVRGRGPVRWGSPARVRTGRR